MIKNQWYAILESKEVKKKLVGVKRLGMELVVFRDEQGKVAVLEDRCPHRSVKLSTGKLSGGCVTCPFHGFKFDQTGKCVELPANGKNIRIPKAMHTKAFLSREENDIIYIFNGDAKDAPEEVPFFSELNDGFTYRSFKKQWNMHYSRCIENQLDVIHVPFVHSKTIGRQYKTLVNGPVTIWDEELMTFYVFNEFDKGQTPLKAKEIKDYEKLFSLQFMMPNIWQNRIDEKIRIMAVFAPIDDENTMIYLRFYQKFMTLPVLSNVVNFGASIFNRRVLYEDHEVVITQRPKKTYLGMDEHLIAGDIPIAEYRRHVKDLKDKYND